MTRRKRLGNGFRASTAPPDATVINNFPGQYPTEDWMVFYWTVDAQGPQRHAAIPTRLRRCLPGGLAGGAGLHLSGATLGAGLLSLHPIAD